MLTEEELKRACDHYGITVEEGRARMEKIDAAEKEGKAICFLCAKYPSELSVYTELAEEENMDVDEWVKQNEGTFNPENNRFACDVCYIQIGMPSSKYGWKAP